MSDDNDADGRKPAEPREKTMSRLRERTRAIVVVPEITGRTARREGGEHERARATQRLLEARMEEAVGLSEAAARQRVQRLLEELALVVVRAAGVLGEDAGDLLGIGRAEQVADEQ